MTTLKKKHIFNTDGSIKMTWKNYYHTKINMKNLILHTKREHAFDVIFIAINLNVYFQKKNKTFVFFPDTSREIEFKYDQTTWLTAQ